MQPDGCGQTIYHALHFIYEQSPPYCHNNASIHGERWMQTRLWNPNPVCTLMHILMNNMEKFPPSTWITFINYEMKHLLWYLMCSLIHKFPIEHIQITTSTAERKNVCAFNVFVYHWYESIYYGQLIIKLTKIVRIITILSYLKVHRL